MTILLSFGFPLIGYLCGSLPFSIWITRHARGVDVRDGGSGHATTTNTVRQAGFGWGALVLMLDIAKGFIPTHLALQTVGYGLPLYIVPITATFAVIGHCWPLFAQFRGGMGLAVTGGALLAIHPLAFLICVGLLILLVLIIHHSARASVAAGLLAAPVLWFLNIRDVPFWTAIGAGFVIAIRFLMDWNRKYRELWLDRQDAGKNSG
jgi:glycerol-3-phosphate acyltransferase PlsY